MIRELAEKVIDTIYDVVIIVDEKLNVTDANQAISSLGYSKDELLGKPVLDLLIDNRGFREVFPDLIKRAATGERKVVRFEAIRKDGSRLWVDITASAIDATPVIDYLLTIRDVDERAKTRKELEEQKVKLESVLSETDRLRREAEESKNQLELANEQLAKRQAVTEQALAEEQKFRLTSKQADYQKTVIMALIGLVAFAFILPYLSHIFGVTETKVLDGTSNLSLLLLQIFSIAIGALYGQNQASKGKDREQP